jgi:6-phosphogluconate dehydrogenase
VITLPGSLRRAEKGDIVVDGGNFIWSEAIERHAAYTHKGIRFLDIGTSGGVSGARNGAAFMVVGEREAFEHVRPLLVDLAVDQQAVFHARKLPARATSSSSSTTPSSSG